MRAGLGRTRSLVLRHSGRGGWLSRIVPKEDGTRRPDAKEAFPTTRVGLSGWGPCPGQSWLSPPMKPGRTPSRDHPSPLRSLGSVLLGTGWMSRISPGLEGWTVHRFSSLHPTPSRSIGGCTNDKRHVPKNRKGTRAPHLRTAMGNLREGQRRKSAENRSRTLPLDVDGADETIANIADAVQSGTARALHHNLPATNLLATLQWAAKLFKSLPPVIEVSRGVRKDAVHGTIAYNRDEGAL